jgi:hypothetical protein
MNITFEKPILHRSTPQENIAVIDRWISDTVDKLNMLAKQQDEGKDDGK